MSATQSKQQIATIETTLPLIKSHANQAEQQGHISTPVLNALIENGVFKLFVSADYNGKPTDLPTALKIFELIASADGATGWLAMIGAGGGLFAGFMQPEIAHEIYSPDNAVIAGSGMPAGIANTVDKGFEVSGRWAYASGAHYATWFTANYRINGDSEQIISLAVPSKKVTIHNTWQVMGMKATGSHDFSIEPTFVAKQYSFNLFAAPVLNDPIYKCPLMTLASLSFASVAVGIARHGMSAFEDFAGNKRLSDTQKLADESSIQKRISAARDRIDSSQQELYQLANQSWQKLENGEKLEEALQDKIDNRCIEIVAECVQALDSLKTRAGMMAVFNDSEFGRAWRDIHVLSQHVIIASKD